MCMIGSYAALSKGLSLLSIYTLYIIQVTTGGYGVMWNISSPRKFNISPLVKYEVAPGRYIPITFHTMPFLFDLSHFMINPSINNNARLRKCMKVCVL